MALNRINRPKKLRHDGSLIRRVYGCMEWFSVAEQPPSFTDLPVQFSTAYNLWKIDGEENFEKISELLSPFIFAHFVAPAISGWQKLFMKRNKNDTCEFEAVRIHLAGVDFSETPFPVCRAEAWFDVPMIANSKNFDLQDWQNEHKAFLSDAISFSWSVPRNQNTESLDFTYGSHLGAEVSISNNDK